MTANSKIEWTDATWNPVRARLMTSTGLTKVGTHCEHVSDGCRNCYAETFNRRGLPNAGTGLDYKPGHRDHLTHYLDEKMLLAPLRRRKPTRYFLSSLTDIFGAWVTDDMLDRLFAVMALCPQHTFQVLTKRPERMRIYLQGSCGSIADAVMNLRQTLGIKSAVAPLPHVRPGAEWWPLPNVWLGTSVEDQAAADERIPHLLATPAAVRFLSCEPLLGAVDVTSAMHDSSCPLFDLNWFYERDCTCSDPREERIDWVIVGGESGPGPRPMHPDWARNLRDQCAAASVPFFFKQWGEFIPCHTDNDGERTVVYTEDGFDIAIFEDETRRPVVTEHNQEFWRVGKARAGRLLDGIEHNGVPE